MASSPPNPPVNPALLIFDSDALIQIVLAGQAEAFLRLRRNYGIQPSIVEAIEVELLRNRNNPKKQACEQDFLKARDNGSILVLSENTVGNFTSNDPRATYESIQQIGMRNSSLDYGEAYSHAAAVVLRCPIVSNDKRAIQVAQNTGVQLGSPILRSYDIFVWLRQIGHLDDNGCDAVRQRLVKVDDRPHGNFAGRSFVAAIPSFYARLVDAALPVIGSATPIENGDIRLTITQTNR